MPYTNRSPQRNSWARREKPRRRKARNITQNPVGGAGIALVLGKMISVDSDSNPSFLAFFRSASSKAEGIHSKACFFAPFFAILDWYATRLMGMQWRGTRGLRERMSARKKKKRRRRSNELVNSKIKRVSP
jgi:hypothetical protein